MAEKSPSAPPDRLAALADSYRRSLLAEDKSAKTDRTVPLTTADASIAAVAQGVLDNMTVAG